MEKEVFTYTLIKNGKIVFRGDQASCYRTLLDIKTNNLLGSSYRPALSTPIRIYKPRYFDKLLTVSSRFEHSD